MSRCDCIKMVFALIFVFALPRHLRDKFMTEVIKEVEDRLAKTSQDKREGLKR